MIAKIHRTLFLSVIILAPCYGANTSVIWESTPSHTSLVNPIFTSSGQYQLKPMDDNQAHQRHQLYFQGVPVWGFEIIKHSHLTTGLIAQGIEQDIKPLKEVPVERLRNQILPHLEGEIVYESSQRIIYIDPRNMAHDSSLLSFFTSTPGAPQFIIDNQTGEMLLQWDELKQERIGQGFGGNTLQLPYRPGEMKHFSGNSEEYNLGPFDVVIKGKKCLVKNQFIKMINAQPYHLDKASFPMTQSKENNNNIHSFSYPCSKETGYVNEHDNNTAPVNYSFSPINDAMYFATRTIEMYQQLYDLQKPLGDDLPLKIYTHINKLDNAFSVSSVKSKGIYTIHQQIVIGDGLKVMTAPAQGSVAHELSHNVTSWHSRLVYQGQSGGINESFSDMSTIALQDYIRGSHPWYWDGEDWSIGREITLTDKPLRYMDSPSRDKKSIEHADRYIEGMNVHHSSGVFNKAFYLLSHKEKWNIKKAFQVMVDANVKYWTPRMNFNEASCGVIQAAKDRHYPIQGVVSAFDEVGVRCPVQIN